MLRLMRKKAQSTAEYAIVIGLVIAAAVAMQVYVKRGLQAKVRGATNYNDASAVTPPTGFPGSGQLLGKTIQYEPDYTTTEEGKDGMHVTSSSEETTTTAKAGGITKSIVGVSESSRTGIQITK